MGCRDRFGRVELRAAQGTYLVWGSTGLLRLIIVPGLHIIHFQPVRAWQARRLLEIDCLTVRQGGDARPMDVPDRGLRPCDMVGHSCIYKL
jgi:hypothetical protein